MEKPSDHGTLNDAIAAELRAARAFNRLTYDDLAARSGISRRTVIRLLNGERAISMKALEGLSRAFGWPASKLIAVAEARRDETAPTGGVPARQSSAGLDGQRARPGGSGGSVSGTPSP